MAVPTMYGVVLCLFAKACVLVYNTPLQYLNASSKVGVIVCRHNWFHNLVWVVYWCTKTFDT